jgi:hypothetical protein
VSDFTDNKITQSDEARKNELLALKRRILNPAAAAEVRARAERNRALRKPFDEVEFRQFVEKHSFLTKLHLVSS